MKRLVSAAGLVLISVAAHAATGKVDSASVGTRDACRAHACVAIYAPGYGARAKIARVQKDQSRFVSTETAPATRANDDTGLEKPSTP